jgi:hypothetical protein
MRMRRRALPVRRASIRREWWPTARARASPASLASIPALWGPRPVRPAWTAPTGPITRAWRAHPWPRAFPALRTRPAIPGPGCCRRACACRATPVPTGGSARPATPPCGACTDRPTPAPRSRDQGPPRRRWHTACACRATTGTPRWAARSSRCARYARTHALGVVVLIAPQGGWLAGWRIHASALTRAR